VLIAPNVLYEDRDYDWNRLEEEAAWSHLQPPQSLGGDFVLHFKVIVEKHSDGYVAYPLGLKGVVVGEGDTYEDALADVKSAITFHIETFGDE